MTNLRISLLILLAATLLLAGCSFWSSGGKTSTADNVPQYSEAEVVAKVYKYISDRLAETGAVSLNQLEPEKWKAKQLRDGEWQVTAIGVSSGDSGQPEVRNDSGAWRYYARLDLVVPYNQEARNVFP